MFGGYPINNSNLSIAPFPKDAKLSRSGAVCPIEVTICFEKIPMNTRNFAFGILVSFIMPRDVGEGKCTEK